MKYFKTHTEFVNEGKFDKKKLMKAMKKDDGMIQLSNGKEYVIYNPDNGNDDNTDMWQDKVIFGLDQDGEEHEIRYSDIVSYNESRKINLKQDHLSPAEYQMAKKLKDFSKDDWRWNNKTDLYDKVNEINTSMISGTSGRTIDSLENRKYELKKDVKGARIGDFVNVTLPKGTIIYNLPGGLFADHFSLKSRYTTPYGNGPKWLSQSWGQGVSIRQMPETLADIEKNSKVLESEVNEAEFKHINKDEHAIKLAIKDVEKKARLKANRDKPLEYEQLSLNKIMLSKVLGREKLGKEHQDAWKRLKKEYNLTESLLSEGKSYQEKFKEEDATYQEMINDPSKRVYDIVDFAQFTTGGMTQRQWEMFMYGRYKKDLQSTDSKIKEKMYKVLNKWLGESIVTEGKFDSIDVKDLHFEIDPKTAEEMKIELGKRQGEVVVRKQIQGGEYSLRRFRKEIKYDTTGKDLDVFRPGSYMSATSTLGDGPHKKTVKAKRWNQTLYDKWLADISHDNDGMGQDSSFGFEMAQNAKQEPGLIDWVKKNNRGEDPLQRIQWDIEASM